MDFDPTSSAYAYADTLYDFEEEDDDEPEDDCWAVISGFFAQTGLFRQQLDSVDEFVQNTEPGACGRKPRPHSWPGTGHKSDMTRLHEIKSGRIYFDWSASITS
ncbi:hypothetical protein BC835DRAFT_1413581 [Cytidiella melzeri]|nr:hypothetical protein BC835DRAFT_1413581 [Cytidiella melzeri]